MRARAPVRGQRDFGRRGPGVLEDFHGHAQCCGRGVPSGIVGQRLAVALRLTEFAGVERFLDPPCDFLVECRHSMLSALDWLTLYADRRAASMRTRTRSRIAGPVEREVAPSVAGRARGNRATTSRRRADRANVPRCRNGSNEARGDQDKNGNWKKHGRWKRLEAVDEVRHEGAAQGCHDQARPKYALASHQIPSSAIVARVRKP